MPSSRAHPRGAGADRPRRSHAERTAETRARIIAAVVECIDERGLQSATAARVAERAGVTWGAVQHHFGGKSGLLLAVLEDSVGRLRRELDAVPADAPGGLAARVPLFVDAAWRHFSSAHYRSIFEILLHAESEVGEGEGRDWRERMRQDWEEAWGRLFGDAPLPRRRQVVIQAYAVAVLTGLATTPLPERVAASIRPAELELLTGTLVRELSGGT